jgi:hypothetical protein
VYASDATRRLTRERAYGNGEATRYSAAAAFRDFRYFSAGDVPRPVQFAGEVLRDCPADAMGGRPVVRMRAATRRSGRRGCSYGVLLLLPGNQLRRQRPSAPADHHDRGAEVARGRSR